MVAILAGIDATISQHYCHNPCRLWLKLWTCFPCVVCCSHDSQFLVHPRLMSRCYSEDSMLFRDWNYVITIMLWYDAFKSAYLSVQKSVNIIKSILCTDWTYVVLLFGTCLVCPFTVSMVYFVRCAWRSTWHFLKKIGLSCLRSSIPQILSFSS